MKAIDLDYRKEMTLSPETGFAAFKDSRLMVLDVDAFGTLRESLLAKLGFEEARAVMLRFGYQAGFADFLQVKNNYEFESEEELLLAGFRLQAWEGLAQTEVYDTRFSRPRKELSVAGKWVNSCEAEQHSVYHQDNHQPVCWTLAGYVSGWCTAFLDTKVVAVERFCAGKGDKYCEWLAKTEKEWGLEARYIIEALKEF